MADNPIDVVKGLLPSIKAIGITSISIIAGFIIIFILMIIIGVVFFVIMQNRRYKNTIIIFDKINGKWVDVDKDKALEITFSDLGATIFYFKKYKIYKPKPKIQSGFRRYYFRKRSDGELENFDLQDSDTPLSLKMESMERDMMYANTGIRKGLKERYEKLKWYKEYAPIIVSVIFIILIIVGTWLLFDKWIKLAQTTTDAVKTAREVLELAKSILANIDTIKSGGSGIVVR
jgi:ABC-type multidrug transport system fused ATPase/permease subunit